MDPRADRIAAEAARLLDGGEASTIADALREAVARLDLPDAPRPGPGRVRQHLRALAMGSLGAEGYADAVRSVLTIAEEIMTALEFALPGARTRLAGRAARGLVDGGVTLHLRVRTDAAIGDIARVLVEQGYEEPAFETAETRHGRLDRLRFAEEGTEVCVTRIPSGVRADDDRNLFTGAPIATVDVEGLRALVERSP